MQILAIERRRCYCVDETIPMFQEYIFTMALPDGIGPLDELIEKKICKLITPTKKNISTIHTL